jgi:hypothetical protein
MNDFVVIDIVGSIVAGCGAIFVAGLFIAACPPAVPPVTPDASDAAAVVVVDASPPPKPSVADTAPPTPPPTVACPNAQTACDHMKAVGCREGAMADCARVLCSINSDPHFAHYNLSCIATATTSSAVKVCGGDCTP